MDGMRAALEEPERVWLFGELRVVGIEFDAGAAFQVARWNDLGQVPGQVLVADHAAALEAADLGSADPGVEFAAGIAFER